jgi:hypothetical protein
LSFELRSEKDFSKETRLCSKISVQVGQFFRRKATTTFSKIHSRMQLEDWLVTELPHYSTDMVVSSSALDKRRSAASRLQEAGDISRTVLLQQFHKHRNLYN